MPVLTNSFSNHVNNLPYSRFDLLRVYTFYRILLGVLLLLMFQLRVDERLFGGAAPALFYWTSLSYTSINLVFLLWMWKTRFQPSVHILFSSLMIDAGAYMLLLYASGGAASSLAYLLLVAIAAGGIMLHRSLATLQAAITSIAIVGESIYRYLFLDNNAQSLFASSLLGCFSFAVSLLFQHLARKIQISQEEAQKQAAHANHLQHLAHLIIERMYTGIVVINPDHQITLMNNAAARLLAIELTPDTIMSADEIGPLKEGYEHWVHQHTAPPDARQYRYTNDLYSFHFSELTPGKSGDLIVFIEDVRALSQQAQQMKLASLGRLTASIAHEIRNPLGAISHAAQLLGESDQLLQQDARLVQIVQTHSKRVNSIIDNVLNLSRRKASAPALISLQSWMRDFIAEFIDTHQTKYPERKIAINFQTNTLMEITAYFDESQLRQILTNLCDNGLRYTRTHQGFDLRIDVGVDPHFQQPSIRVIDFGDGITQDQLNNLFEPFFTTESTGSGLGLYISRELCEANQALITYNRTAEGFSCFELKLSHPKRSTSHHLRPIITTAGL